MDVSLDDYISREPTLQAAIVGARFRAKFNRRIYNFGEFEAESYHNEYSEMDKNNNPEEQIAHNDSNGHTNKKWSEKAYLPLNVNEEEDFIKRYEQLNSTLKKKPVVTTKECAVFSNIKNTNDSDYAQASDIEAPNKIDNLLKQPGFDLRQMVDRKNQLEEDFMPKSCYNNSNNKRKLSHCGTNNNHFAQNNTAYPNKRSNNGHNANVISLFAGGGRSCSNSNGHHSKTCSLSTTNGNFDESLHAGCCSFHAVPTHINLCQGCLHNKNTMIENGLNFKMNGAVNQMGGCRFGCGAFGSNCTGAFNTSKGSTATYYSGCGCTFNNRSNASLINAASCACNLSTSIHQHENILNKSNNGGDNRTRRQENIGNNGVNFNAAVGSGCSNQRSTNVIDVNKEDPNNGNDESTAERTNIAAKHGVASKVLQINSVPVMLAMMQGILKYGITLNMFSENHNQSSVNSKNGPE